MLIITYLYRSLHRVRKVGSLLAAIVTVAMLLGGCDPLQPVYEAINELEDTSNAIKNESTAWRGELPKLIDALKGLEASAGSDVKEIIADTKNQVQDLATQTIQLSDAKAQDLIAQAGVEFRCNADFVKVSVLNQLQYLIDDLTFWKQNKKHLARKPKHAVCWINPAVLHLHPNGSGWSIDPSTMSDRNIVRVFGYNFRSDALPTLELQDAEGRGIRNVNLLPTYVTAYQVNLDFSNENFAGAQPGGRVVFRWPDQEDPNAVNLVLNHPARLKLSSPVFTPSSPTALGDPVVLKVTVTNQGGVRSGSFDVIWKPDPADSWVDPIGRTPLNPGESIDVSFSGYQFKRGGVIQSAVSLSTGDDTLVNALAVTNAPPPPPIRIASAPCPVPISTIALPAPPNASDLFLSDGDTIRVEYRKDMGPNQLSVVLQSASNIRWWKGMQLEDESGKDLGTVETQDDNHGPVSMTLSLSTDDQVRLILQKAKRFGEHRDMYCVGDLTALPGYTVVFTWLKDG